VLLLLHDVGAPAGLAASASADPEPAEVADEQELRDQAANRLPLDLLVRTLSLSAFEQEALLLCAAVEVDRRYERIFAEVEAPFAFVDLDAMWSNAGDMLRRASGKPSFPARPIWVSGLVFYCLRCYPLLFSPPLGGERY